MNAGVAQLVERNLAKVEVESSRLFSRSSFVLNDLTKDASICCHAKIQHKTETGSQHVRALMVKQRP